MTLPFREALLRRRTAPELQRCRQTLGKAHLIQAPPSVKAVANAVYVPFPSLGDWGIYDAGQEIGGANKGAVGKSAEAFAAPQAFPEAGEHVHLYLGIMTAHFGHFVTDVIARLWPMLAWQAERPKLLYHGPPGLDQWRVHPFLTVMLGRFGLSIDDLVCFEEPHRIPNLVVPSPCFKDVQHAHLVYRELCKHVGRPFWNEDQVDTEERPVFLSKLKLPAGSMHKPDNEEALVEALERGGVEIVFPEDLEFPDQVSLLARRKTVMGIAGSALHTSLYSAPRRRIIALNYWDKINANFQMIDHLNDNAAFYYGPHRTRYTHGGDYLLRWTIENPLAVAAEMLERAEDFSGIDARDGKEDAARDRRARSIAGRAESAYRTVDRWLKPIAARLLR